MLIDMFRVPPLHMAAVTTQLLPPNHELRPHCYGYVKFSSNKIPIGQRRGIIIVYNQGSSRLDNTGQVGLHNIYIYIYIHLHSFEYTKISLRPPLPSSLIWKRE